MTTKIIVKIRSLIEDTSQSTYQTYTASSGRTFTIAQENTSAVTSVTVSGTALDPNDYSYDSDSQIVIIDEDKVVSGNAVVIYFIYNSYSDIELLGFIDSALFFMDGEKYNPSFQRNDTDLIPIPNNREQSLIVLIARILINPNYNEYRLPNLTVRYPRNISKDEKIKKLINRFKKSKEGITGIIKLD